MCVGLYCGGTAPKLVLRVCIHTYQYGTDVPLDYIKNQKPCIAIRPNATPRESITTRPIKMPLGHIN